MNFDLHFPPSSAAKLEPYLPPRPRSPPPRHPHPHPHNNENESENENESATRPFVTLTFATSLDSGLALAPGARTALSGPQSKAMTHFLRSRHAAICVGAGTAAVDDPGLNCRLASLGDDGSLSLSLSQNVEDAEDDEQRRRERRLRNQPRPIVLDPRARWAVSSRSKVVELARAGFGLAPYVFTAVADPPAERRAVLEACGGKYVVVPASLSPPPGGGDEQTTTGQPRGSDDDGEERAPRFRWADILAAVRREGLDSIMVEGGGNVINSLLGPPENELVNSVIVTIAPTWLGRGSVAVAPARATDGAGNPVAAARLRDVAWHPLGEDVVLCGRIMR